MSPQQALRFIIQTSTYTKLMWRYGPDRADRIVAGQDPAANADLAAWRSLGRRP